MSTLFHGLPVTETVKTSSSKLSNMSVGTFVELGQFLDLIAFYNDNLRQTISMYQVMPKFDG